MIHQDFSEPNTPEWIQWKQECQQATQELTSQALAWQATQELISHALAGQVAQEIIDRLLAAKANQELINRLLAGKANRNQIIKVLSKQSPKINGDLYKRMRQIVFAAFHGKCAYCEAKFVLDQTGEVEHFRPKGQVLDGDGKLVFVKSGSTDVPHPGYYWLAYDWRNLLPSCNKCNNMTKTSQGTWIGKGARFPVKGAWASKPGDEAHEEPMLIHPVLDDPEKYLQFDEHTGLISARDENEKGKAVIKIFGLNDREGLPEARRNVYDNLVACMHEALDAIALGSLDGYNTRLNKVRSFQAGSEEYSLAGRAARRQKGPEFRRAVDELVGGP